MTVYIYSCIIHGEHSGKQNLLPLKSKISEWILKTDYNYKIYQEQMN
jgi:hypothetical protein